MKIPILYNVRSVLQRPLSTTLTGLGVALVVAVFIGTLALANGFRTALVRTGSDQNALVLRRGADSELSSGLTREAVSIISASPHVAKGSDGRPLLSPEVYVLIPLPRIFDETQVANVVVRGISEQAWSVRSNVEIVAGHKPQSGRSEICVGRRLLSRFGGTGLGRRSRRRSGRSRRTGGSRSTSIVSRTSTSSSRSCWAASCASSPSSSPASWPSAPCSER